MRVRVVFFALFRDYTGRDEVTVELRDGATVGELLSLLSERVPGFREALEALRRRGLEPMVLAGGSRLGPGDRIGSSLVYILPPAAGGVVEARVVRDEVSLDELASRLLRRAAGEGGGALVAFVGFVKGRVGGARVRELVYEALEPLASEKLREIAEKYSRVEGVIDVIIYHRVGALKPGEPTIYILVTAVDRATAFRVASQILEEVKHEAPISKLERRDDGDYWVVGDGVRIPSAGKVREAGDALGGGGAGEA